MTFPPWPQFAPGTARRVAEVLRSSRVNYWTGEQGAAFERAFAAWVGSPHAFAVANGTAALQLALAALGVGPGDDVVVTPYSFVASSSCAAAVGARPVYADVGDDHALTAETVARVLTPRTKAIVVVHLFGLVADLGPILRLARARGIAVVEDCAQCLGGECDGRKVGTLGDVGCFSFCQAKHFTTGGEGGMVVCRGARTAKAIRSLRDHGWDVGSQPKTFGRLGWNFRMTEMQSAIGLSELARLDSWNLPRRRRLAERLIAGLRGHPLVQALPVDTPGRRASFWIVPFVLDAQRLAVPVADFIEAVQAEGASAYRILWQQPARRANAARLAAATIGFWVHPVYTARHIDEDLAVFRRVADRLMRGP